MAAEWFYKTATNKELGPFTAADMKTFASDRRIGPTTSVRKSADGQWIPASKVKGLVDAQAARPEATASVAYVHPTPPIRVSSESTDEPEIYSPPVPRLPSISRDDNGDLVPSKKGASTGLLIGAVAGSLLVVGLIVLVVSLSRKSGRPSQNVAVNPATPISTTPNPADVEREQQARLAEEKRQAKEQRERDAQQREEIRIAEEKQREKEQLAREYAEHLRTRTSDVRNVCWGDSRQTVKQVEKIALKQDGDSLSGHMDFYGHDLILHFTFYEDKLVEVSYWKSFGEFGNPFEIDATLRNTLEDKYGKGKTTTFGINIGGIDMNAASRKTVWDLPRNTIELRASSYDHGRSLFLTYEAKTAEARAYKEQQKRKYEDSLKKEQEKLKKNL